MMYSMAVITPPNTSQIILSSIFIIVRLEYKGSYFLRHYGVIEDVSESSDGVGGNYIGGVVSVLWP